MPDVHIQIELDPAFGNPAKATRWLQERDRDFLWPERPWWHKPPNNPRGVIARAFSRYGCKGRLSVMPAEEGAKWNDVPIPHWTGITPRMKKSS